MTSSTAISILVGSLSVGLGWFLNEVSQLFRNRSENRRIKNRVLHDLLEMNFVLSKLNLKPMVDLMISEIQHQVQIQFSNSDKEQFSNDLHKTMLSKLEDDIIDELEDLDENYQNSILELSKVDPIRAYYLRYKNRLLENFDKIESYISSVKNDLIDVESRQIGELNMILNPFITNQFTEEIENLRKATIELAKSIGFRTKSKVSKILAKQEIKMTDEMSATIQPIIKQLLEQIETQHGQTKKRS
jgi:hypothetical protein